LSNSAWSYSNGILTTCPIANKATEGTCNVTVTWFNGVTYTISYNLA
jgi:hypothetical protein